jgi:cytochrome c oxidase assembly factor CtaG
VEHAAFLGVALAFWSVVMRTGPRRRAGYLVSMLLAFGTMLESTWLAAVLTFGGLAYPVYAHRAPAWGIGALADQQLAGALMWVPSAIVLVTVTAVLFARWFHELDRTHAPRPEAMWLR